MMAKLIKRLMIQMHSLQRNCSIWTSDNYLDEQLMSAVYFNDKLKTQGICPEECTMLRKDTQIYDGRWDETGWKK